MQIVMAVFKHAVCDYEVEDNETIRISADTAFWTCTSKYVWLPMLEHYVYPVSPVSNI